MFMVGVGAAPCRYFGAHVRNTTPALGFAAALAPLLLVALTQSASAAVPTADKLFAVELLSAICVVIFGGFAAFFYFTGRKYLALAAASAAWPTAHGKVLICGVIRQRGPKGTSTYSSNIVYEYTVAGVRHQGHVIQFGSMDMAAESAAQKILDPYPVGSAVTVHYSPGNPKIAALETSPAAAQYRFKLVKWTLLMGLGIYVALVAFALYAMS
jgi:hypothetical protein